MIILRENGIAIVKCGDRHTGLHDWSLLIDELDRLACPAVIDASLVNGDLSEIDAYLLALHADETSQFRHQRVAVVLAGEPERHLGFFVVSARSHGMEIQSFASVDRATAWAMGDSH